MGHNLVEAVDQLHLADDQQLCAVCNQITVPAIVDAIPVPSYPKGGGCGVPNFFEYSTEQLLEFADIKESSQKCKLCSLLLARSGTIKHGKNPSLAPLRLAGMMPPTRDTHTGLESYAPGPDGKYVSRFAGSHPQWQNYVPGQKRVNTLEEVERASGSRMKECELDSPDTWGVNLAADSGTAAANLVSRRPFLKQCSDSYFKAILQMVEDCQKNHPKCALGVCGDHIGEAKLPTRVIDLRSSDPGTARIIIPAGKTGRYATLSHCWGSQRWVATTQESLPKMMQGFSLNDIPGTYADAIKAARRLNVDYLWVDSFCIVQDDLEDWLIEAQKMDEVYEHASINIAATAAKDGSEGFLGSRESEPTYIRVPQDPAEKDNYVYFTNQEDSSYDKMVRQTRITSRGWVLQERILSRRTIHFAQDQWYFECGSHIISEDGWQHERHNGLNDYNPSLRREIEDSTLPIEKVFPKEEVHGEEKKKPDPEKPEIPIYELLWTQILRAYSKTQLSYAKDKMPALQGLANRFQTFTPAKYHFGHWLRENESLPLTLMWCASLDGGLAYPDEDRAPSWSCLKGDGWIGVHDCRNASPCTRVDQLVEEPQTNGHAHGGPRPAPRVAIHVRGKVRRCQKSFANGEGAADGAEPTHYSLLYKSQTPYGLFTKSVGPAKFDHAQRMPAEPLLLLAFTVQGRPLHVNAQTDQLALVLEAVEGAEGGAVPTYRRIGLANVNTPSFFSDVPFTAMKIV